MSSTHGVDDFSDTGIAHTRRFYISFNILTGYFSIKNRSVPRTLRAAIGKQNIIYRIINYAKTACVRSCDVCYGFVSDTTFICRSSGFYRVETIKLRKPSWKKRKHATRRSLTASELKVRRVYRPWTWKASWLTVAGFWVGNTSLRRYLPRSRSSGPSPMRSRSSPGTSQTSAAAAAAAAAAWSSAIGGHHHKRGNRAHGVIRIARLPRVLRRSIAYPRVNEFRLFVADGIRRRENVSETKPTTRCPRARERYARFSLLRGDGQDDERRSRRWLRWRRRRRKESAPASGPDASKSGYRARTGSGTRYTRTAAYTCYRLLSLSCGRPAATAAFAGTTLTPRHSLRYLRVSGTNARA